MKHVHSLSSELMALCQRFVNGLLQPKPAIQIIHTLSPELSQQLDRFNSTVRDLSAAIGTPRTWNVIRVRDLETGLVVQGRISTMQITDTQKTRVTFGKPVDKKGFPAEIQGDPVFAASDDAITLTPVDGDPYSIDVAGNHPSAKGDDGTTPVAGSLTISGDADLGDGVSTITGVEPYIVTGGSAAGFAPATVGPVSEQ